MKLILISDTHGLHEQVNLPEGNVLIHAGDITSNGKLKQVQDFAEWFQKQPHQYKIIIAGNHDWALEAFYKEDAEFAARDIFGSALYLRDSEVTINGVKFYGSPWQPTFYNWAFNTDRGPDIKAHWDNIPNDTDVLITHGPPWGFLDQVGPDHVGCEELSMTVTEAVKPQIHVFGHIHCGYGYKLFSGTQFYNAALCNEMYQIVNKPWVVEI